MQFLFLLKNACSLFALEICLLQSENMILESALGLFERTITL